MKLEYQIKSDITKKKKLKNSGHMVHKYIARYVNHWYKNSFAIRWPQGQQSKQWSNSIRFALLCFGFMAYQPL